MSSSIAQAAVVDNIKPIGLVAPPLQPALQLEIADWHDARFYKRCMHVRVVLPAGSRSVSSAKGLYIILALLCRPLVKSDTGQFRMRLENLLFYLQCSKNSYYRDRNILIEQGLVEIVRTAKSSFIRVHAFHRLSAVQPFSAPADAHAQLDFDGNPDDISGEPVDLQNDLTCSADLPLCGKSDLPLCAQSIEKDLRQGDQTSPRGVSGRSDGTSARDAAGHGARPEPARGRRVQRKCTRPSCPWGHEVGGDGGEDVGSWQGCTHYGPPGPCTKCRADGWTDCRGCGKSVQHMDTCPGCRGDLDHVQPPTGARSSAASTVDKRTADANGHHKGPLRHRHVAPESQCSGLISASGACLTCGSSTRVAGD